MTDALEVRMHGQDVGEIVRFKSGRIQFEFDPGYTARRNRPTLSQSFLDDRGDIVDGGPATRSGELPPFFPTCCRKATSAHTSPARRACDRRGSSN